MLESAIWSEAPDEGLIVHTDRGSQFIANRYQAKIEKYGIVTSMSNASNTYDNAIMESFNISLKTEMMNSNKVFATREQAKKAIFEYIELFYNRKRRYSSLGYYLP